jgi:hypothetical protein
VRGAGPRGPARQAGSLHPRRQSLSPELGRSLRLRTTLDLATRYLGLELAHPIVASPSPLARDLDGIRRLEDAGAAAIVLPSTYEEEVEAEDA